MKADSLFREAVRGVWTGTSRAVAHTLVAAALSSALVVADASITRTLIDEADEFRSAGGSTLIITAADAIEGPACDALASIDGVEFAGALQEDGRPVIASALPGAPLKRFFATRGLAELLVNGPVILDGLVISRELADALLVSVGDVISTADGQTIVGGIYDYPSDGRRPGLGWAVIEITDRAIFSECWATSWPLQPRLRSMLLTALTIDGASNMSNPPTVAQLNASRGQEFNGAATWGARITAFGPLATFILVGVFALMSVRLRRLELASNLHAGVRRRSIITIALLESSTWILMSASLTVAVGFAMTTGLAADDAWAVAWIGFQQAAGVTLGGVVGTILGVALVRERQLFRYFKNRT